MSSRAYRLQQALLLARLAGATSPQSTYAEQLQLLAQWQLDTAADWQNIPGPMLVSLLVAQPTLAVKVQSWDRLSIYDWKCLLNSQPQLHAYAPAWVLTVLKALWDVKITQEPVYARGSDTAPAAGPTAAPVEG
jgi:hypothetical protein